MYVWYLLKICLICTNKLLFIYIYIYMKYGWYLFNMCIYIYIYTYIYTVDMWLMQATTWLRNDWYVANIWSPLIYSRSHTPPMIWACKQPILGDLCIYIYNPLVQKGWSYTRSKCSWSDSRIPFPTDHSLMIYGLVILPRGPQPKKNWKHSPKMWTANMSYTKHK